MLRRESLRCCWWSPAMRMPVHRIRIWFHVTHQVAQDVAAIAWMRSTGKSGTAIAATGWGGLQQCRMMPLLLILQVFGWDSAALQSKLCCRAATAATAGAPCAAGLLTNGGCRFLGQPSDVVQRRFSRPAQHALQSSETCRWQQRPCTIHSRHSQLA